MINREPYRVTYKRVSARFTYNVYLNDVWVGLVGRGYFTTNWHFRTHVSRSESIDFINRGAKSRDACVALGLSLLAHQYDGLVFTGPRNQGYIFNTERLQATSNKLVYLSKQMR